MSEFLQRVEAEIQKHRLLPRGQKILVAVSGGADSMALLAALHSLAPKKRWQISIAHFNHRLRGRASDADEKLVRRTAATLRLKFFGGGADVQRFAAHSKCSVEMAARKLRHEFLARTARGQGIPVVALAHHADDQVELFFLRLLRGTGGEGLAGMKWRSPSPADKEIALVRPLLGFSKTELLEFACENKISFREDATNFSTDFLRNRIRNDLLPLLQKNYQPGLAKTVLRLMEITGAEAEFVSEMACRWERRHPAGKMPALPECGFDKLPVAVQRRVLLRQLTERGLAPDFELIEQLREVPGKFVSVASNLSVARDATGKLTLREHRSEKFNADELKLKLAGRAGRAEFGGLEFRWALKNRAGSRGTAFVGLRLDRRSPRQTECFDAAKVGSEIILRHWRAGDRFQPIGLKSAVKLQDLFVNAKIPAARRRALVLATTAAGGIFWVDGLRIGERFKLTPATRSEFVWNRSKLPA